MTQQQHENLNRRGFLAASAGIAGAAFLSMESEKTQAASKSDRCDAALS
ncbi:MAG: twin-arginine translocation signal domain-containing protein [Zetaproteobacteria bacterium]|nr:twin-arginine translocation signal domain-containing protein [Zetaproteobacteria bacterium]